ncbi:hypothetical protein ABB37_08061 [Leptomonas pyrrhocoris]|uniref:Uncharacterized protein n=1 Tax=Leptomonas pyrrhocoris TaxID=157538 RepID=A0A0M9FU32_LEPPY|nr:hypothetical protein ABB37_08061 [Leptomonas pyrrhocoris]XP_015654316.1 hypothetical protein ABB37_08061 [Leptomonas pyrrhocoris]KPA75876.1 hypothetical protein ABB37_08061 [Leptomonas pyrrhocoris]KPA75877.1 hypothetical protein ABB37_08061 [Leptomonas pyrrhocoris]|eukprot:XP_015654315.1 hypothetical protein ABB37_08061 [Leptomonas pyrrhocoris]
MDNNGNGNMNNSVGGYVPAQQGGEGGAGTDQNYYYYYEMPDGSIGYITADEYNQMYTPSEQRGAGEAGPQPAGYVEPTYGQGTAYAPAQEQYVDPSQLNANNSNYYNSNNNSALNNNKNSTNIYYSEDSRNAYYGNASTAAAPQRAAPWQPSPQQQPAYPQQVVYTMPQGAQQANGEAAEAMTAAPQPALPHETASGGWYAPPPTFATMRDWKGEQKWYTSLARSCCNEPCFCLGACLAPWCVVAAHRKRLLEKDYTKYRCCAGVCGRGDACECCGDCPRCNLFWEVLLCLPCACHANRYMLMQRYNLKKSCWDSTVLGLGCFCAPCHWCGECTCWFPESMWDWLYVVLYACMLTQHHRELDAHEKAGV